MRDCTRTYPKSQSLSLFYIYAYYCRLSLLTHTFPPAASLSARLLYVLSGLFEAWLEVARIVFVPEVFRNNMKSALMVHAYSNLVSRHRHTIIPNWATS